MNLVLPYGVDSTLELDLSDEVLLAYCDGPRRAPETDAGDAARRALEEPVEMVPLRDVVAPGDRVALAIDRPATAISPVVGPVVETLVEGGVDPEDITLLVASAGEDDEGVPPEVQDDRFAPVRWQTHSADDRTQNCYLAANEAGEPIYLDRRLVEADVVVPVGCLRSRPAADHRSVHGCLFPQFSDSRTQQRLRREVSPEAALVDRVSNEVDEVGRLLGVMFTVQVVAGRRGQVLDVLAGEPSAVFRRGRQLRDQAWRFEVPRRASLVIAAVAGSPAEQTWENVARALAAATDVVDEDGAIAVCCDLAAPPDAALRRIAGSNDPRHTLGEAQRDAPCNLFAATQIVRAQERARLYLMSRLDDETVEELGLTPLANERELGRLVGHHTSCIVLANAQDTEAVVV